MATLNPASKDPTGVDRIFRHHLIRRVARCICAICILLVTVSVAFSQDDPFGGNTLFPTPDLDATPVVEVSPAGDELPRDANIVVRMLREEPPKSLLEIAQAVKLMNQLRNWSELGRYLDQLSGALTKPEQSVQLADEFGTDLWLSITLQKEISETQRATAQRILSDVSQSIGAPKQISESLKQLSAKDQVDRLRAAIEIQRAGALGLKALIEAIAAGTVRADSLTVDLIDSFGPTGIDALRAAMGFEGAALRNRLLIAASAFVPRGLALQNAAAIYDPQIENATKSAIRSSFQANGLAEPSEVSIRAQLLTLMTSEVANSKAIASDANLESLTPTWIVDSSSKVLSQVDTTPSLRALIVAAKDAISILQMGDGIDRASVAAAAVLLQRDYAVTQSIDALSKQSLRDDAAIRARESLFGKRFADQNFWIEVFRVAMANDLPAAQLRSVQIVGLSPERLSHSPDAVEMMLEAVKNSPPAVRMAALETLQRSQTANQDPRVNHALVSASEKLVGQGGKPVALVVGGAADLRSLAVSQLGSLGISTIEASSARETIRSIGRSAPIDYVLIVDRLYDMRLSELVQRVHAFPQTGSIPISILVPEIGDGEATILRESSAISYGTLTNSGSTMEKIVEEMNFGSGIPLPSQTDRLIWNGIVSESQP